MPGTKSYNPQTDATLTQDWWIVDGEDQIVGRIAADIAMVLMGKHRPTYGDNIDTGDFVVITNCDKVRFTGKKWLQKTYRWYTGYQGQRSEAAGDRIQRRPETIMTEAVRRMLPKNKVGRQMLSKLKVYPGTEHPHQAQNPKKFEYFRSNSKPSASR